MEDLKKLMDLKVSEIGDSELTSFEDLYAKKIDIQN